MMQTILHSFANYAVPTAIIVVMMIGVFSPPRWVVSHLDRRTKAYEDSQKSIADSVDRIQVLHVDTLKSIHRIEQFSDALANLRERDNEQQAVIVGKCNEAVAECRRLADSCEIMAAKLEPRRDLWTEEQRKRHRMERPSHGV